MSKVDLRLDWVGHDAAKFAVEHWHYSKTLPAFKALYVGVWEDRRYIGMIAFSPAMNPRLGVTYGLNQFEVCELVRVALDRHVTPVTRLVKIAIGILKRNSPGLRLIISYADINQNHYGGIYQAGNWIYSGQTEDRRTSIAYLRSGRVYGWRAVSQIVHDKGLPSTVEGAEQCGFKPVPQLPKFIYLYPLDDDMRRQIEPLRKPYPKRESANEAT